MDQQPTIIAEIGCVHIGCVDRAKMLARLARDAGAHYAKFQKRNPIESTPKHLQDKPHPNASFAYGNTYLEHRLNLELNIQQHAELKTYCESIGIGYATSVWDKTSAKEVISLQPDFIKIPSALNHDNYLIEYILSEYKGELHISLGMTTEFERSWILKELIAQKDRIVLYHCTSAYPCPFEKLYLKEIQWLAEQWPRVGFSNHGKGIAADIAALALGARYFERHFVDDRMFPHTDASSSLEVPGLSKLCRDLKNVHSAFGFKPKTLDPMEAEQRAKLRGC